MEGKHSMKEKHSMELNSLCEIVLYLHREFFGYCYQPLSRKVKNMRFLHFSGILISRRHSRNRGDGRAVMEKNKPAAEKSGTAMEKYKPAADESKQEIKISVRSLVEFILRQGDINSRHQGIPENAMSEGGRIHRMIQKRMGSDYQAEVFLRYAFPAENYVLIVEGRADGIIDVSKPDLADPSKTVREVMIDEIKGTYRDLSRMKEPIPVHLAQARCYAYIYSMNNAVEKVRVRMTYCNIDTEDIRYFYEDYEKEELVGWFDNLIAAYRKWADYNWEWKELRQASIEQLDFPFPYREGQKELVTYVYQTIYHKKKLFLEAPTGVGKTISTIFPSVKAMAKGMGDKLFYLTAKTITRTVAENTFRQLREQGLRFKSIILTAKDKICFMEETQCNPEYCSCAKGHYDRVNDALYDLLTKEESFTREKIEEYALKYCVCPFEMCLDLSLFADGIICDYNYLFDPHVYLKRFFGENSGSNYIFLIDEAHNLLERGREMYSASLQDDDFLELKRELHEIIQEESAAESGRASILVRQGYAAMMEEQLDKCNEELLKIRMEEKNSMEREYYRLVFDIDSFVQSLTRLHSTINNYLEEQEDLSGAMEEILDFYFTICHFLEMYELVDENYVKHIRFKDDGNFLLKLFCVNPSVNLRECMNRGRSAILFSATFLPIQYYKRLLGGESQDYEVYAKSVFRPDKKTLLIASDVTSKYSRRSESEYHNIAKYIQEIVKNRHGNYMVFCPSHSFLQAIYDIYVEHFAEKDTECIVQQDYMNEQEREEFLKRFEGNEECNLRESIGMDIEMEEDHSLVGFCVLGGIFSEGIDLKNDRLIGVIIVGTGLPQVCEEREILKNYFDADRENGFDYSYRYPGMNKVLQAAGRVIRTDEDIGVIALLDERFLQYANQKMFPKEWEEFEVVTVDTVAGRVERFWDSWL